MPAHKPFAPNCGNQGQICGVAFDHQPNGDITNLQVNNTQISGVTPEPLKHQRAATGCDGDSGNTCGAYFDGTTPASVCGPYAGGSLENTPTVVPANTFGTANNTENFGGCRKIGFKNVQARRRWRGYFGWLDCDMYQSSPKKLYFCDTDHLTGFSYSDIRSSPVRTKYLALHLEATDLREDAFGGFIGSQSLSYDQAINPLSGELTLSNFSFSSSGTTANAAALISGFYNGGFPFKQLVEYYQNSIPTPSSLIAITHSGNTTTVKGVPGNYDGLTFQTFTVDPVGGNFSLAGWSYIGDPNDPAHAVGTQQSAQSATINNTTFTASGWYNTNDGKVTFSCTGTLSSTITDLDTYADLKSLLELWPLTDHYTYPWRIDSWMQYAPLVSRLEYPSDSAFQLFTSGTMDDERDAISDGTHAPYTVGWTPTYNQIAWKDLNVWRFRWNPGETSADHNAVALEQYYTGEILGAPNPWTKRGYFDFRHENWKHCDYQDNVGNWHCVWYLDSYGQGNNSAFGIPDANSTLKVIPLNATQWTNNYDMATKPPGAWMFYAVPHFAQTTVESPCPNLDSTPDEGFLVAQKYAEIKLEWPSYNAAKPGGNTRYELKKYYCIGTIYSGSGLSVTLVDVPTDLSVGELVGSSAPDINGWYQISAIIGADVYLVAYGGSVPPIPENTDLALVTLRWPFPSTPGIEGDGGDAGNATEIASLVDGTGFVHLIINLVNPQPNILSGDLVDFLDANFNVISSAGPLVQTGSTSQFTMLAVTVSMVAGAKYIIAHSTKRWWYDNDRKGTAVFASWESDYRDVGEANRWNANPVVSCAAIAGCDCSSFGAVTVPRANQATAGMPQWVKTFTQEKFCMPYADCTPLVLVSSPCDCDAVDKWPKMYVGAVEYSTATVYSWPTPVLDEQYGYRYQAEFYQTMNNPFWQDTPAIPSGCRPDGYEPPARGVCDPPQVEARLTLLTGGDSGSESAPALPTGIYLGWLTLAQLEADPTQPGDVLPPPSAIGYAIDTGEPNSCWTAWGFYISSCSNHCANILLCDA